MEGRAATVLKGSGLQPTGSAWCAFGIWPFEGRLFPQRQPRWPKMMGDRNRMSLARDNCLSARDTKIPI